MRNTNYKSNNVLNVNDVKDIMVDYVKMWSKEEMERNIKVWFDDECGYKELFDEG